MKLREAEQALGSFEGAKRVFRARELGRLFGEKGDKLRSTIRRLRADGIIENVGRDLYWFSGAAEGEVPALEEIAAALRPGDLSFIALESAASLWDVISQIPVDRLTLMTTGRSGTFPTRFGTIEFVHTAARIPDIVANTVDYPGHAMRFAA